MKEKTCCFTGHRPNKLPWGYNESGIRFFFFYKKLKRMIEQAISKGYINFITGMALGVDMIVAEIVLELKKEHPNIKLECAIPCINQAQKWSKESIVRHKIICEQADKITMVSNNFYFKGCMAIRNKYMINNSSTLIAVFNGSNGGTKQTIKLAENNGLDIIILKP